MNNSNIKLKMLIFSILKKNNEIKEYKSSLINQILQPKDLTVFMI